MRRRMELSETEWMDRAKCKDEPLDKFFNHRRAGEGIKVCIRCPVKTTCLQWRIDTVDPWDTDYGVWGATTPVERDKIKQLIKEGRYYD